MEFQLVLLTSVLLFAVSMLYSSVGHGGASGYIAVMGLLGVPIDYIRPVALSLNIVVAGLTTYRFCKAGYFDWKAAIPLVITSVPLAFVGGSISLPSEYYRPLLGVLLLFSAGYLVWQSLARIASFERERAQIPTIGGLGAGGVIGFISGLSGIGGGVMLSPLLLTTRWASVRQSSAIAAVFILANSCAGLAGNVASVQSIPAVIPVWVGSVLLGAWIGSELGTRRLSPRALIWLLAAALLIAGGKFLLT